MSTKTWVNIPGLDNAEPVVIEGDSSGYNCRYCDHTKTCVATPPDYIAGANGTGATEDEAKREFVRDVVRRGHSIA